MTAYLPIRPSQSGYAEEPREAAFMYRVEGGRPRGRQDFDEVDSTVVCTWRLRPGPYGQLMAFYRAATEGPLGPQSFEVDLVLDGPTLERYSARFKPGTMKLESFDGSTYTARASLEIERLTPIDANYDVAVVDMFEEYGFGEEALAVLAALAELVNEELPA